MVNGLSDVRVDNCSPAHECVWMCLCVTDKVFFERIVWTSNHCANWNYIVMLDKLGVDQGEGGRRKQLLAWCFTSGDLWLDLLSGLKAMD